MTLLVGKLLLGGLPHVKLHILHRIFCFPKKIVITEKRFLKSQVLTIPIPLDFRYGDSDLTMAAMGKPYWAKHSGCLQPYKSWDRLPINWDRISSTAVKEWSPNWKKNARCFFFVLGMLSTVCQQKHESMVLAKLDMMTHSATRPWRLKSLKIRNHVIPNRLIVS